LMMGGDLLSLDDWTKSLLTNPEVIAVNQHSSESHPVITTDSIVIWTAKPEKGKGHYVAVFNIGDNEQTASYEWKQLALPDGNHRVRDLWEKKDTGKARSLKIKLAPHASVLWRVE
jgi:alpha-galactosidase